MSLEGIYILGENRRRIHGIVSDLSGGQQYQVPEGFKNHIAWNVAHMVATQQLLHYDLGGLEMHVPASIIDTSRKGTSPHDWNPGPDWNEVLELFKELPDRLAEDYSAGRFRTYAKYTTLSGLVLRNIDEAIHFNNFHEGTHLGIILAMLKLTGSS